MKKFPTLEELKKLGEQVSEDIEKFEQKEKIKRLFMYRFYELCHCEIPPVIRDRVVERAREYKDALEFAYVEHCYNVVFEKYAHTEDKICELLDEDMLKKHLSAHNFMRAKPRIKALREAVEEVKSKYPDEGRRSYIRHACLNTIRRSAEMILYFLHEGRIEEFFEELKSTVKLP